MGYGSEQMSRRIPKPEGRNPKEGRRPKSESATGRPRTRQSLALPTQFERLVPPQPTLSPRERENHPQCRVMSTTQRISPRWRKLFPLPEGEGQGEGEQDARLQRYGLEAEPSKPGRAGASCSGHRMSNSLFGFRVSAFLRISDFGLRISQPVPHSQFASMIL